jgi:hypothetical protein
MHRNTEIIVTMSHTNATKDTSNSIQLTVPTKNYDGGSSTSSNAGSSSNKKRDSFLHYSNDKVRMRALMMVDDTSTTTLTLTWLQPRPQPQQKVEVERKTCISFELHPSLIMDDLLLAEESTMLNELLRDDVSSLHS